VSLGKLCRRHSLRIQDLESEFRQPMTKSSGQNLVNLGPRNANSKHSIFQRLAMSSAPPHYSPQRLRFGEFLVDIVRFKN